MTSRSEQSRLEEMRVQVSVFHRENHDVWSLFVHFTQELIKRGFQNYSVNAIFERIRWECDSVGGDGKSTFKLNNNYRAFYARRFHKMYPQHEGFFRTRKQVSEEGFATKLPELTPKEYG